MAHSDAMISWIAHYVSHRYDPEGFGDLAGEGSVPGSAFVGEDISDCIAIFGWNGLPREQVVVLVKAIVHLLYWNLDEHSDYAKYADQAQLMKFSDLCTLFIKSRLPQNMELWKLQSVISGAAKVQKWMQNQEEKNNKLVCAFCLFC